MRLDDSLIHEFAEQVSAETKEPNTTFYGVVTSVPDNRTVPEEGDPPSSWQYEEVMVRFDGATADTPAQTGIFVSVGDRVSVHLLHHRAIIVGNISAPGTTDGQRITNFGEITANYIRVALLEANYAKISYLEANYIDANTIETMFAKADLSNIGLGVITTAMIATGAVDTAQIKDGSITDAKIVSLTASKITAGTLDAASINVINLNAANLTVGKINGTQIDGNTIGMSNLTTALATTINEKCRIFHTDTAPIDADINDVWFDISDGFKMYRYTSNGWSDEQFGGSAIAASAISASHLDAGAVTTDKLAANAVTAAKIASSTITANEIASRTITAGKIASGTITANEIAAGTITAAKINVTDLFAQDITASGTIRGVTLVGASINANSQYSIYYPNQNINKTVIAVSEDSQPFDEVLIGDISMGQYFRFNRLYGTSISGPLRAGSFIDGLGRHAVHSIIAPTHGIIDKDGITELGLIFNNGSPYVQIATETHGAYGVNAWASDSRLKKNIQKSDVNATNVLNQLNVVSFDWKDGGYHVDVGLVADDVVDYIPNAVFEVGDEKIKNLSPGGIIPYLVKAVQELSKENENLKSELYNLRNEIDSIKSILSRL